MAGRRRRAVDERTDSMSAEALYCRSFGHAWSKLPVKPSEKTAYRKKGQTLLLLECRNGCTYERRIVLDSEGETVSDTGKYREPKSYLVQAHGSGRLRRSAARNAFLAVAGD